MVWNVITGTKWELLNALSENRRMDELATRAGTSVANASKHLQLLEAMGYVSKHREHTGEAGKPAHLYSLDGDVAFGGVLTDGVTGRFTFTPDSAFQRVLWRTFTLCEPSEQYGVCSFLTSGVLEDVRSMAFLRSEEEKIEFFALAEDVEAVRDTYSNVHIDDPDGSTEVVCWAHHREEVQEGLDRDDDYYHDMVRTSTVIYDPDELMRWNDE